MHFFVIFLNLIFPSILILKSFFSLFYIPGRKLPSNTEQAKNITSPQLTSSPCAHPNSKPYIQHRHLNILGLLLKRVKSYFLKIKQLLKDNVANISYFVTWNF